MTLRHSLLPVLVVALAATAAAGATGDESDPEPVFGIGWQDGVTLHWRFAGDWYVEGAAGPRDRLHESMGSTDGARDVYTDERREQGWVRLCLGWSVWRRGRLDFAVATGLRYEWENSQANDGRWDEHENAVVTRRSKLSDDAWEFFVAARPRWRLHERVSAGFDLGFAYSWHHLYETTTTATLEVVPSPVETQVRRDSGHEFTTLSGWDGLGALHFIFWF